MFSKVVVLLVCLSVVKATVFTVNAYEDENNEIDNVSEDVVAGPARTCVSSLCNRVCRRFGHARGFCVSPNVCRCRGRLGRLAAFDAEEVSDPEVAEISNVADESAVRILRSCGYDGCNAFCRKMGYARGVCIGTYCQCRMRSAAAAVEIPKPEISYVADIAEDTNVRICQSSECNRYCRKRGYARGVCIDETHCQCRMTFADISRRFKSDEIAEPSSKSVRNCNLRECAQSCRRVGFRGGVCVNGRCKCDILRSASPVSESDFESDEIAEPSSKAVRNCNLIECAQSCRRVGFRGGVCVNGRCKCDILRSASPLSESDFESDEIAEPSSKAVRNCNLCECAQSCRRVGFLGGACVNGRCKCHILRSASPLSESDFESDEIAEPSSKAVRNCNLRECAQPCRRIGFRCRVCLNDRCKCNIRRSALPASEDNNDKIAMDANPEDDVTAAGDDSSENSVY